MTEKLEKTINYCFEFKVTFKYKHFLNISTIYNGVYPKSGSLEKTFLKYSLFGNTETFLELLREVDSKPVMKKKTEILTTDMKIVRSENEPTKLEWYFRISDFYKVKVDKKDNSHTDFLNSDRLKERLTTFVKITNFVDKKFVPNFVLGSPESVEVVYKNSYIPETKVPLGTY